MKTIWKTYNTATPSNPRFYPWMLLFADWLRLKKEQNPVEEE